jgi:hypothetical protein
MEKYVERTTGLSTTGWNVYTFMRFFVPGMFTAFWLVLFAVRMTQPITMGRELLDYLLNRWQDIIGFVVTFGGFLGILFVGIDPIIRAFMGSRTLNLVFKYLLSSKKVDFAYFQFMRLHDIMYRYERLPKKIALLSTDDSSCKRLAKGDYSSRYLGREIIQNYFWDRILPGDVKSGLTQRAELSSTFLYLSFASLSLFAFQTTFYVEHLTQFHGDISKLTSFDYIPLVLVFYIMFSLLYNAYYYKLANRKSVHKAFVNLRNSKRKLAIAVSFSVFFVLWFAFHQKISDLTWIGSLDTILFVIFFASFVSFYWSSTYQLSRYEITFEHAFRENWETVFGFIEKHSQLMSEMDIAFSRKLREQKIENAVTLRELRNRIERLKTERTGLLAEEARLKEKSIVRIQELQNEVAGLKTEIEELKGILKKKDGC